MNVIPTINRCIDTSHTNKYITVMQRNNSKLSKDTSKTRESRFTIGKMFLCCLPTTTNLHRLQHLCSSLFPPGLEFKTSPSLTWTYLTMQ